MIITTSAGCSERRWDAARGSIGISLYNYNMEETQVELSDSNESGSPLYGGSYRIEWIQRTFLEDIFAVRQHACRYLPCPSHSAELS